MAVSKAMDSTEVAQLVRAGRTGERAYVEEQFANLFTVIDRDVKTMDMPKLTPEVARRRVSTLLSVASANRLQALAEVRLYQAQDLLTAQEVEAAFEIVGGADGLTLLHGTQEKKLEIARQWVLDGLGAAN